MRDSTVKRFFCAIVTCSILLCSSCSDTASTKEQATAKEGLSSVSCYVFRTEKNVRVNVLEILSEVANRYDGKVLQEPQEVYLKVNEPEFYLFYTDRQKAYGNLVETFWLAPDAEKIDAAFETRLNSTKWVIEDCKGYRKSSTSRFDFPDKN